MTLSSLIFSYLPTVRVRCLQSTHSRLVQQSKMYWIWCVLLFYVQVHGYDPLSPRFRKVLHSLNGPAGENLKAKIMFGIEKSNLLHSRYHSTDQKECNQRLHYIMRDELMCPIVANAILKYLDILQFRSRMGMDERLAC